MIPIASQHFGVTIVYLFIGEIHVGDMYLLYTTTFYYRRTWVRWGACVQWLSPESAHHRQGWGQWASQASPPPPQRVDSMCGTLPRARSHSGPCPAAPPHASRGAHAGVTRFASVCFHPVLKQLCPCHVLPSHRPCPARHALSTCTWAPTCFHCTKLTGTLSDSVSVYGIRLASDATRDQFIGSQ